MRKLWNHFLGVAVAGLAVLAVLGGIAGHQQQTLSGDILSPVAFATTPPPECRPLERQVQYSPGPGECPEGYVPHTEPERPTPYYHYWLWPDRQI